MRLSLGLSPCRSHSKDLEKPFYRSDFSGGTENPKKRKPESSGPQVKATDVTLLPSIPVHLMVPLVIEAGCLAHRPSHLKLALTK